MAGVNVPQYQKRDSLGKVGMITGGIVGGMSGGPSGAMQGAQTGGQIGGVASSLQNQGSGQAPQTAMGRREDRLRQANANLQAISEAQAALAQQPPEQQALYADPLARARKLAEQGVV